MESFASLGTPFYCTVGLPERRYELGGRVVRSNDGWYRVEFGYADHGRMDHRSFSSNVMLHLGETRVLNGTSSGLVYTLVLEPVEKSPAPRASLP